VPYSPSRLKCTPAVADIWESYTNNVLQQAVEIVPLAVEKLRFSQRLDRPSTDKLGAGLEGISWVLYVRLPDHSPDTPMYWTCYEDFY
jgi:hypothetical protein